MKATFNRVAFLFVIFGEKYNMNNQEVQNLPKNQKVIAVLLLVVGAYIIFSIVGNNKEAVNTTTSKVVAIPEVTTVQKKTTDYHTPDNYVLDYYHAINNKDWNTLKQRTVNSYNENSLKGFFEFKNFTGIQIVNVEKISKEIAIVTVNATYLDAANVKKTTQLKVRCELAQDYLTWLINPLTVF